MSDKDWDTLHDCGNDEPYSNDEDIFRRVKPLFPWWLIGISAAITFTLGLIGLLVVIMDFR